MARYTTHCANMSSAQWAFIIKTICNFFGLSMFSAIYLSVVGGGSPPFKYSIKVMPDTLVSFARGMSNP